MFNLPYLCFVSIDLFESGVSMYYFSLDADRQIFDALEICYTKSIPHPSRNKPSYHDFVYMLDGVWDFQMDGVLHTVSAGDVFVLPAGSTYEGNSLCTAGTRDIFLHVSSHGREGMDMPEGELPGNYLPLGAVVHCKDEPVVKSLFEEICHLHSSDRDGKQLMMSQLFSALLYFLHNCDNRVVAGGRNIVDDCLSILKMNRNVTYKESEISEMLFVSAKTLRSAFVKRFNKTFHRYQIDDKLEQAYTLLKNNPEMKVYEVAYELGFCDEFHLSKAFKKKFGLSPADCKRKYRARSEAVQIAVAPRSTSQNSDDETGERGSD